MKLKGHDYTEDVRDTPDGLAKFIEEGHRTFPRVFLNGVLIGGADDLAEHFNQSDEF